MPQDPLLQPFQLKHLTLRNRIISTAHEPFYSEDGMPKDRYRLYHVEKAKGGIALTMTAGSAIVSPDCPPVFGNLLAYKDEIVPWMRSLSDECHEHGTAVMIQITHLGRRTAWNKSDWLPVLAPSPIREPAHRSFPKAAEDWDIDRIVRDYAAAAARMEAAGLDGIEINAYGHLPDQFFSPATNQRDDEYGGSLDNRLRFTYRVLDAIRQATGHKFLVGIRMTADEDWEIGLSRAEGIEIACRLAASGKVDFLNIIRGHIETDAALSRVIPIQGTPLAPHLDFAGDVRAATKFPVFHAARIQDIATARHAIAEGKLDMVGMTRAHIADPHIVRKLTEGREFEIRPCVGATYCLDRIYEGNDAVCIHNPATGREATLPHVIARTQGPRKKIVVAGAGPAGLEAARVASARGHAVTLFEATDKPGGQVNLACRVTRRKELMGIIEWRMARLESQGAAVHFSTWAEPDPVLAEQPDVVFVATGGVPNTEILHEGNDLVVSTWDILSGEIKPAGRVLVYDDNGAHPAMQAAEFLAQSGSEVEIITPERYFAPEIGGLNHAAYAKIFLRHNVRITINTRLLAVQRHGNTLVATLGSDYGDETSEREADQIIVEHGTLPVTDLYDALKPLSVNYGEIDYTALLAGRTQEFVRNLDSKFRLFRIGDAVSSRNIHAAVYDALRLAKDL
ncbi:MAG: NADH:flavin oxidoreductase [Acetobacteraceae bacterium]|nr:NADH:flavin oxidoreductase [Acetobacteraceae bacterium]